MEAPDGQVVSGLEVITRGPLTPEEARASWEQQALERARECCVGCGGTHKLRVQLIVPEEAGGERTLDNSTVLCRACEMARDAVRAGSGPAERPVNFWASRHLYNTLQEMVGERSMSGLVRYLISSYARDPKRFDDIGHYQDGPEDLKINVWVGREAYSRFKELVNAGGMTVTFAIKALILMCAEERRPHERSV